MYAIFKGAGVTTIGSRYTHMMVGILYQDSEETQINLEKGNALKELLMEKIDPIVHGFSKDLKVFIAMDFNFMIRKIELDKTFFEGVDSVDVITQREEAITNAVNFATRTMLEQMQKHLDTNNADITLKQFVDRAVLNHKHRDIWVEGEGVDEHGNKIAIEGAYFDYPSESSAKLAKDPYMKQ